MVSKKYQTEYGKLNERQKEAVDFIEGPVMVIAGPGTGKTQIMAMRVANILNQTQVAANNILVLTFTESGVHALKERLLKIIGPLSYQVHVHTFHSFCNEVILTNPEKFLFAKSVNHLSELEQAKVIQKILSSGKFELLKPLKAPLHYQNAILKAIGELKQEGIGYKDFQKAVEKEINSLENDENNYHQKGPNKGKMKALAQDLLKQMQKNEEIAEIFKQYQAELSHSGKYDYADMILFVLKALEEDSEILSFYQEKFQYILVDEYQDTNSAQNKVVQLLASFHDDPNVFVVGDDEQSIYRFQGAALENILLFTKSYPKAKIIVLDKNYRSNQLILNTSRKLIEHNQNQLTNFLKIKKSLKSQTPNPGQIYLSQFTSEQVEAYFIAKTIQEMAKKGNKLNEIAVLYRRHRDVEKLAEYLGKLGIPFILEVGENILFDPEISKILRVIKILGTGLDKPEASADLFQMMHFEFFQIPTIDIYQLTRWSADYKVTLSDLIVGTKKVKDIKLKKPTALNKFGKKLLEIIEFDANHTFSDTFEFIINTTGFLNYLIKKPDAVDHLKHLESLFNEVKKLNLKDKNFNIRAFCQYLKEMEDNNLAIKAQEIRFDFNGVHLMTAHKSKGLEFDTVFLLHLTDGNWGNKNKRDMIHLPSGLLKNQSDKPGEEEEERRLFYVALTRARKNVYLTWAEKYGESDILSVPSKFLLEISAVKKLNTEKYENDSAQRLSLEFSEVKWHPTKAVKQFLQNLVKDFSLSATSLNTYLACPHRFFFDNLLRVPKTKTADQAYGTAAHFALEMLYRGLQKDEQLPPKQKFIEYFIEGLSNEILNENDFSHLSQRGSKILGEYFDFYKETFRSPLALEYNFTPHQVHFNQIPITGKIDKIDIVDLAARSVKITDYKTSSPKSLNYLLGQTKENDLSFIYQAFFYRLLAECDPLFNWRVKEIEFDFLTPNKDKFTRISIPIDEKKYAEFKQMVVETHQRICKLDFLPNKKSCLKGKDGCVYKNFCG